MTTEQQTPVVPATEAKPKEQTQATTPAVATPTETPAEIMIPKHRYDEVSNKLKAMEDAATKKAMEDAAEEERRKIAQGEWQKLAESHKAKVEELTPKAELANQMLEWFNEYVKSQTADWPESLKAFDPGDEAGFKVRTTWLEEGRKLAAQLQETMPPQAGNGRRPPPISAANTAKVADAQRQTYGKQARVRYR